MWEKQGTLAAALSLGASCSQPLCVNPILGKLRGRSLPNQAHRPVPGNQHITAQALWSRYHMSLLFREIPAWPVLRKPPGPSTLGDPCTHPRPCWPPPPSPKPKPKRLWFPTAGGVRS